MAAPVKKRNQTKQGTASLKATPADDGLRLRPAPRLTECLVQSGTCVDFKDCSVNCFFFSLLVTASGFRILGEL